MSRRTYLPVAPLAHVVVKANNAILSMTAVDGAISRAAVGVFRLLLALGALRDDGVNSR